MQRLALAALGFTFSPLLGCSGPRTRAGPNLQGPAQSPFELISPVNRYKGSLHAFSGDNPDRVHAALANKEAARKGRKPLGPEPQRLVIIGGGMSGILSAYLLRDLKPVLLEKSERLGGNSQGEAWANVEYSIGAAYFTNPEKGSALDNLYQGAGIYSIAHRRSEMDPVLLKGKFITDFWGGASDPAARRQITRVRDFFHDRFTGKIPLPAIPTESAKDMPLLAELDRDNFLSYLVKQLGETLHPHVHTMLELYCWRNLGASMQELSAAIGVTTFAAEFGDMRVAPAGNASVAERFLKIAMDSLPPFHVRPSSIVLDVRPTNTHVDVDYLDHLGTLRRIRALTVVMACPKFVAKRLLDGLEKDRGEALAQLEYRSYLVANACVKSAPSRGFHDLYLLGKGEMPYWDARRNTHNHGSSNVVLANYSQFIKDKSVLTLYHPLPFNGGQQELQLPDALEIYTKMFRAELFEKIFPVLGYTPQDLQELRLTRWGHPIPIAKPGFYSSETPRRLSAPFQERVFFVNQDNWAAPALETCALEALQWAPKVREVALS